MSKKAEVVMSDGSSYQLASTPGEVYNKVTHSDGKPLGYMYPFKTARGETIYLHSTHIVAILEYQTVADHEDVIDKDKSPQKLSDDERKEQNLESAKEFKKELGDNME